MDNKFVQTQPDTYSLDYMDITIVVSIKPNIIIDLKMPENQFNPNKSSCLWYYKQHNDPYPTRCIPAGNLTDCYYL